MAEAAIKKLSLNPNGFYLFVEGGKIDLAHHDTMPVNDGLKFIGFELILDEFERYFQPGKDRFTIGRNLIR